MRPKVPRSGTAGISGNRTAGTPAITRSSAFVGNAGNAGICGVGRKSKSTLNGGSSYSDTSPRSTRRFPNRFPTSIATGPDSIRAEDAAVRMPRQVHLDALPPGDHEGGAGLADLPVDPDVLAPDAMRVAQRAPSPPAA